MSEYLDCLEIDPDGAPTGAVIWLHGLGADASDFEPIVPMLGLSAPIRFIFPNAPVRAVTINDGMEMRAWYDIDPRSPLSGAAEIRESARSIEQLLARENERGVPTHRIVLAGFSQGGVHDPEHLADEVSLASVDVPIFMAHGHSDAMIPIARAVISRDTLRALNYQVEWHEYRMGHQVCPEEISDISRWLNGIYG
jgi:phospholipase/carboxylesterase